MAIPQFQSNGRNEFVVSGELNFMNIPQLWQSSCGMLVNASPLSIISIDLSKVTQSDSSGVALLISWVRTMRQQKKEICFVNLPQQMRAIIEVSGLQKILPIKEV